LAGGDGGAGGAYNNNNNNNTHTHTHKTYKIHKTLPKTHFQKTTTNQPTTKWVIFFNENL
jgi:hypothetical protein